MAIYGCVLNAGMAQDWWRATLASAPESKPAGSEVLGELDRVISTIQAGECTGVDSARLRDWIESLARNRAFRRQKGALLELAAHLSLHRNEPLRALEDLRGAVRASPTPNRQLQLVELQLALGLLEDAETGLDRLEGELRRNPIGQLGHGARVAELRRRLDGLKGGSGGTA
jgi:predicted Zn-dependent protease